MDDRFIVAHVVPTGVGAEIGGYVGDATPATNMIAAIADRVIAHPNVVNAVTMNLANGSVLYTEGFTLDRFFLGETALREVIANRVGVVIDCGFSEKEDIDMAINTINAIRTVKGVNVIDYTLSNVPVGGRAVKNSSGAFVGEIDDENTFLGPAGKLVEAGAEAIAVTTAITINRKDLELYFRGKGPNPYGGTEAIISHTISRRYGIQSAHAPLLTMKEMKTEMFSGVIDPRAGAEAISPAYLGCVLQGLHNAPRPVPVREAHDHDIMLKDLSALVLPASCMGGIPAMSCEKNGIPIIAVEENKTLMKVTAKKLGFRNVIRAGNYLEAAGILTCLKEGIDPRMVRRPVSKLKNI
jgi:hypothetical protein